MEQFAKRHSITEDDVATFIRELLNILNSMHSKNLVHLDIRVSFSISSINPKRTFLLERAIILGGFLSLSRILNYSANGRNPGGFVVL